MPVFLKNKLEEIRNSDRSKKTRWVILMSAAAMAIIVVLWLFYLGRGNQPLNSDLPDAGVGKWEIFKSGFKAITSKLFGPRTINIEQ